MSMIEVSVLFEKCVKLDDETQNWALQIQFTKIIWEDFQYSSKGNLNKKSFRTSGNTYIGNNAPFLIFTFTRPIMDTLSLHEHVANLTRHAPQVSLYSTTW